MFRFAPVTALVLSLTACGGAPDERLEQSDPAIDQPLPTEVETPVAEDPLDTTEPETTEPETTEPETTEPETTEPETTEPETTEPETTEPEPAVCGNGVAETTEVCDGADHGSSSCRGFGFSGGDLTCSNGCDNSWTNACSPLSYFNLAPAGDLLNFAGALDVTDPQWSRPGEACEPGASFGHRFDAYGIVNHSDQPQRITAGANFGDGDGYLHVFENPFNPQTLEGCMVGNDDLDGIHTSGFAEMVLAPNQRLVLVVSTYSASAEIPAYTLDVTTALTLDAEPTEPVEPAPVDPVDPAGAACGNGILEEGELCDGSDLGDASCSAMGYNFGIVACASSCNFYITFCAGGDGVPEDEPVIEDPTDPVVNPVNATPIAPLGQTQRLVGELTSAAPTHQRVDESCSAKTASTYHYEVHALQNNTDVAQYVALQGNFAADGFLALYTTDFDPAQPGYGCLAADDDFAANTKSGASRLGARIDHVMLFPGEVLNVVVSTFAAGETLGNYTLEVKTVEEGNALTAAELLHPDAAVLTQGVIHANDAVFTEANKERFLDVHYVENTTNKTWDLDVLATWANGDGYLYVYTVDEDAPNSLGTLLASDDDFNGTSASRIEPDDLYILPGEKLAVVATSYAANTALGAYDITVTLTP